MNLFGKKRPFTLIGLFPLLTLLTIAGLLGVSCSTSTPSATTAPTTAPKTTAAPTAVSAPAAAAKQVVYEVGGAGTTTTIYGISAGVATIINKYVPEVKLVVVATSGTTAHFPMIEKGEIKIAAGSATGAHMALTGTGDYDRKYLKWGNLFVVGGPKVHFVTFADSPINKLKDISGKKVGIGAKGSPAATQVEQFVSKAGITGVTWVYASLAETFEMLKDGRVDTIIYSASPPMANILEIASTKKVKFIPLTPEEQTVYGQAWPFQKPGYLTSKMYNWITEPVPTVGNYIGWVASSDLPDDIAYKMVKAVGDNWAEINKALPETALITFDEAKGLVGPMHPGALKYYKEKGIDIPANQ